MAKSRQFFGRKPWSPEEIEELERLRTAGATAEEIAQALGRNAKSVLDAFFLHGIQGNSKTLTWSDIDDKIRDSIYQPVESAIETLSRDEKLPRSLIERRLMRVVMGLSSV